MTVLIDSCAWIEYFKGSEKGKGVEDFIRSDEIIIISTINISEVFRFFLSDSSLRDAESAISHILEVSFVIPLSTELAIDSAKIKHEKKWGLADSIILATAKQNNAKVITGDDDFKDEKDVIFLGKN